MHGGRYCVNCETNQHNSFYPMGGNMIAILFRTRRGVIALGSKDVLVEFITLLLILYDEYRGEIPDVNNLSNLDIDKYMKISTAIFKRLFGD